MRASPPGEVSTCNVGDLGLTPGLGRSPGGGHGNPLQYSFLENLHGQRSLEGYSSWGHKESDMTAQHSITHGFMTFSFIIKRTIAVIHIFF